MNTNTHSTNRSKIHNGYRSIALIVFNTLLLLIVINLFLGIIFWIRDTMRCDPVTAKYGRKTVERVYGSMDKAQRAQLLKETWSRPYVYEAYTQFKERAFSGRYVNVDTNGFRLSKNQGPWPPQKYNLNVFVFGGSTAFGYGVADDQTIASVLQKYLGEKLQRQVCVYNFGRGSYFSTQERILFESLLVHGAIPDMAIFVDGLNDFYHFDGEPLFASHLRGMVDENMAVSLLVRNCLARIPITRLVLTVRDRAAKAKATCQAVATQAEDLFPQSYNDRVLLESVIERYFANKKIIETSSAAYGVKTLFVWQPAPTYDYDDVVNYGLQKAVLDRISIPGMDMLSWSSV